VNVDVSLVKLSDYQVRSPDSLLKLLTLFRRDRVLLLTLKCSESPTSQSAANERPFYQLFSKVMKPPYLQVQNYVK
jgi:hypothetical protein